MRAGRYTRAGVSPELATVFEWMEVAVGCVDEFARPAERDLATIAAIRINTISSASGARTFRRMPSLLLADGFDFISPQKIIFALGKPAGCPAVTHLKLRNPIENPIVYMSGIKSRTFFVSSHRQDFEGS